MESHHNSMDNSFLDPSSLQQQHLPTSDTMIYATPPHPATAYFSPASSNGRGSNLTYSTAGGTLYPDVSGTMTSTPLTPTVSPPHYDTMQQQFMNTARKYSVDVGPFGYMSHPRQQQFWVMQQDELMRRSSTATNISLDEQGGLSHPSVPTPPSDYTSSGDLFQQQQQQQFTVMPPPSSSIPGDAIKKKQHVKMTPQAAKSTDRPNVQHKHVCKYAFCGWSFKRYEHLKRHMLVHTGERPYQCRFPGCGKSFSRSDNFHAHCRTHTKKAMQQQQQQVLGNTGNQKKATAVNGPGDDHGGMTTVSHHTLSTRTDDLPNGTTAFFEQRGDAATPLYEQHANSIIDSKSSFHPHNAAVVPPISNQPTMTLNHETSFHNHQQPVIETTPLSSSAGSPFTTFSNSSITTSGMLLHPFPFGMNTTSSAQQQQQSPIQLKSHMCPVLQCQRRFKRLEHLKRHMRIHTLERPFPCTFPNCNKAFSRSDNLSQHMKTHQRHEDRRKRQLQQQRQHQHEFIGTIHASGVDNSNMGWRNPNNDNTATTTTTTISHHHPAITTTATSTSTASVGC